MRRDILTKKKQGIPQPPPTKHPFLVKVFQRLLTKAHPAGRPSLEPTRLAGTADLLKLGLEETVPLVDEDGAQVPHRVVYDAQCVTGKDLVANTAPDRVLTLAAPTTPSAPHEPGLPLRLGYEIQALYALQSALADEAVAMPEDFLPACGDEETRLVAWLDLIEKLERRFFQKK
jgi:hypothetical protein